MQQPLVSDAAAPMKRALHAVSLPVLDVDAVQFDVEVPAPAVLRLVTAHVADVSSPIVGAPQKRAIVPVLVFEVDPDAQPVPKRYYVLLLGRIAAGKAVADMLFVGAATLPNGAPVAVYELPPRPESHAVSPLLVTS